MSDFQLDEHELQAQWRGIASRRLRYRRRQRAQVVAAAAGLAGAIALALTLSPGVARRAIPGDGMGRLQPAQSPSLSSQGFQPEEAAVRNLRSSTPGPSTQFDVTGVDVEPGQGAKLRLCTPRVTAGHCWRVTSGRVDFDVTPGRSVPVFVRAGAAEVRVLGTRFSVAHGVNTEVAVTRGRVEVRSGQGRKLLKVGETWTSEDTEGKKLPARRVRGPRGSSPVTTSAEGDWRRAEQARRQRSTAAQISGYRRFLDRHPEDPRAALAALQLGRLHMDQLQDDSQALSWLRRASRRGLAPALLEDALARLVRIHDRGSASSTCRRAQRRYLKRFPEGLHSLQVRKACAE